MNPGHIMKSDVLDILFENRNKAYGAYYIRRHYNGYLLKSLLIALSLVALLLCICAFKPEKAQGKIFTDGWDPVTLVPPPTVQPPLPPPPAALRQKVAAQKATLYRIASDETVTEPPPDINDLVDKKIGLTTIDGPVQGDIAIPEPGNRTQVVTTAELKEPEHTGPYEAAMVDQAAEYPGGLKAMMNFLLRNLYANEDLTERVKVKVQFIIGEDGKVRDCKVLRSAGENIDQQVPEALRKMPTWKPAKKNGKEVAMYFVQPVVFDIANN